MKYLRLPVAAAMILPLVCSNTYAAERVGAAKLAGSWTLVLVDNILPNGERVHLYGPDPQGFLTFDENGRYALQIYRANRSRFAANDKSEATPDENSAAVQGSNSHFGSYAIDDIDRTIVFYIEHASFPNWEGTEQMRSFSVIGDHLKYTMPTPTSGGSAVGEVEWKRAR
jgi:hypothetical protein